MAEVQQVFQAPDNSFFLDLLKHNDDLDIIEHTLKGEVRAVETTKDEKGNTVQSEVWKPKYRQKMNDYGVMSIISFLKTVAQKNVSITILDPEFIDKLTYDNIQNYTERLVENFYEYGFDSIADLNEVDDIGRNFIVAQFNRAQGGRTLTAITSNTSIHESREVNNNPLGTSSEEQTLNIMGRKIKI